MSQRPSGLPDFENPPVQEVAISGHFEPLVGLRQAHLGYFWSKIRQEYPKVEDHELLTPQPEPLKEPQHRDRAFRIEWLSEPTPNRAWFVSSNQSELLQVQRDRFVYNWRGENNNYPHFESLLENFTSNYNLFCNSIQELELPELCLVQAEVTYANRIDVSSLDRFLNFVTTPILDVGGVASENVFGNIGLRFPVYKDEDLIGRLHVDCFPELSENDENWYYHMNLTFKAPISINNLENLKILLLQGREAIVHSFAKLTRTDLHKQWDRVQ